MAMLKKAWPGLFELLTSVPSQKLKPLTDICRNHRRTGRCGILAIATWAAWFWAAQGRLLTKKKEERKGRKGRFNIFATAGLGTQSAAVGNAASLSPFKISEPPPHHLIFKTLVTLLHVHCNKTSQISGSLRSTIIQPSKNSFYKQPTGASHILSVTSEFYPGSYPLKEFFLCF